MKKIQKKLHLSDEGFSLMELIVTMLVSAVVTAAAAGFLVAGVQFYNRANAEANLQKESQVAELFLTELIQEAVDYKVITSCPTGASYALQIDRNQTDGEGNKLVALVVQKTDGQLWYAEGIAEGDSDVAKVAAVIGKGKNEAFLADCVTSFSVSPGTKYDATSGTGLVRLVMTFEEANKTYNSSATISLRNKKKN